MPKRDVEFLQMPCSLSSGEYPLLTSSAQSLAGHTKATLTCKVLDDLRQKIKVPAFSGWSDCNMVRMGGNLYWILEANTSTDSESSVEMIVSYCGPSSIIHKGDNIVGTFERLPANKCAWLKRTPMSGSPKHTRTIELPNLGYQLGDKLYWVQVTYQETTSSDTVATKRAGYFVTWNATRNTLDTSYARANIGAEAPGKYISLKTTLSDIADALGTTASSVLDVSISERCPFAYYAGTNTINLTVAGAEVYPTMGGTDGFYYDLDKVYDEGYLSQWTTTQTITLTDLEQGCGTITIRDESTASIGEIPASYGTSITLDIRTVSDFTGVTTYVSYGGYQVALPEGKLPWNGTAWEEYRAYSLAYDRQAMNNSINYANQRVAVGIATNAASSIQSAATGFIGGDPLGAVAGAVGGAASFAISTWASYEDARISNSETRATQALAERRAEGQPSTPYNAGYGLSYCVKSCLNPCAVWVEMPAGLTESIDQDYTTCFGYPAEGLRSVTIQEGYIKGRIYDNGVTRGPRFDRMNETLQNGILFKEI